MANLLSLLKLEEELSILKLEASLKVAIMRSRFSAEDELNALRSAVTARNPTDPTAMISFQDLKLKLTRACASVTDKPCAFDESSLFDVDFAPPSPEMFDLIVEQLCGVGERRQLPLAHCPPDDARAREDECNAGSENTEQDAECNTAFEEAKHDCTPADARAREDECNAESDNTEPDAECNTMFEEAKQDNTEVEKIKTGRSFYCTTM